MAKFTDDFLEDIRAALPPSAVLARKYTMVKHGAEYAAKEDPSVTCNDQKRIWKEFGKGDEGGDIFSFVMWADGVEFVEAVKRCAEQAGIPLPNGSRSPRAGEGGAQSGRSRNDADSRPAAQADGHDDGSSSRASDRPKKPKRTVVAEYDYTDAQGHLIYQVVRFQYQTADGGWALNREGKVRKDFGQRRPAPDEDAAWIWGLSAGAFLRPSWSKDWLTSSDERLEQWPDAERKSFPEGVEHGLYKLPELLEAIADERIIFMPEGERKVDLLDEWGLAATCNSGGSKNWTDKMAASFAGADVVVLIDNDEAGRDRGHKIALSLRHIAKRVRLLDLAQFWDAKPKDDVVDWAKAGGTPERLYEIVDKVSDWRMEPPASAFGALRFVDLDLPAREYAWLVKGVLTRGERSIMAGPPSSGKSYAATDMALTVARAALEPTLRYLGRRVHGGLVLYQAGEGGLGLRQRMRAYRKFHGIDPALNVPFVLMPQKLDLFSGPEPVEKFIEEAKKWAAFYELPVELVVIDTFSAASAGANENISEDMTLVLDRGQTVASTLQTHVMFVHHMNKQGGVRGWSGIMGNIESAIEVNKTDEFETLTVEGREKRLVVREAVITKQKDGEDGLRWRFVLPQVILSYDEDNEPVTACVVRAAGEIEAPAVVEAKRGNAGVMLSDERAGLFSALLRTIGEVGVPPPPELKLPAGVASVCQWGQFRFAYRKRVAPTDDDATKHAVTIKKRLQRFEKFATAAGIIGIERTPGPTEGEQLTWIWPTGKPVFGRGVQYPRRQPESKDDASEPIDPATGQAIEAPDKNWFDT